MTRAAGYLRARRFEQPLPEKSPNAQRARIAEHIASRGWTLSGWWEDVGAEARVDRSAALNELLAALEGVDKIVIDSLDRFGLNAQRISNLMARLRESNVDLIAIEEGFDSAAITNEALLSILAALAKAERQRQVLPPSGWRLDDVRALTPDVRTLIDVGAADGTLVLYEAYPNAELVLIEPLDDFETELADLTSGRGGYVLTAVGAHRGKVTITVPDLRLMSSVLRPEKPLAGAEQREVPISTLDDLLEERCWVPPFGLKIDVEGYEHHVIEGAEKLLQQTLFVIAEVSITARFIGAISCPQFVALMRRNNFDMHTVLGFGWSSLGLHADLAFLPRARLGDT